jgi:uncharacterized protein (DUF1778 family)
MTTRRPHPISIRTSPQERALYERGCAIAGCTISEFVRRAAIIAARQLIAEEREDRSEQRVVAARPLSEEDVEATRMVLEPVHEAYQAMAQIAGIRRRLEADAIEYEAAGNALKAHVCRLWASRLGPPAHLHITQEGHGRIILADGETALIKRGSDDDEDGPPDGPPAPRPAARQEQGAGAS